MEKIDIIICHREQKKQKPKEYQRNYREAKKKAKKLDFLWI